MDFFKKNYSELLTQKNIIVLDTETSGNKFGNSITEIGAVKLNQLKFSGDFFQFFCNPQKKNDKPININKRDFFNKRCKNFYPNIQTQINNFLNFIDDSYIFGYNVTVDYKAINDLLNLNGFRPIDITRYRCIFKLAKEFIKNVIDLEKNYKIRLGLKNACDIFCIDYKTYKKYGNFHTALFDAIMTAKVLIQIVNAYNNESLLSEIKSNIEKKKYCYKKKYEIENEDGKDDLFFDYVYDESNKEFVSRNKKKAIEAKNNIFEEYYPLFNTKASSINSDKKNEIKNEKDNNFFGNFISMVKKNVEKKSKKNITSIIKNEEDTKYPKTENDKNILNNDKEFYLEENKLIENNNNETNSLKIETDLSYSPPINKIEIFEKKDEQQKDIINENINTNPDESEKANNIKNIMRQYLKDIKKSKTDEVTTLLDKMSLNDKK